MWQTSRIAPASPKTLARVYDLLAERYGPIAFGLVALLALWQSIVAPEMAEMRKATAERSASVERFAHDAAATVADARTAAVAARDAALYALRLAELVNRQSNAGPASSGLVTQ